MPIGCRSWSIAIRLAVFAWLALGTRCGRKRKPLPRARQGADQSYKEFRVVNFYAEGMMALACMHDSGLWETYWTIPESQPN
ncbi:MAG: hypothetical protein ACOX1P_17150 [Thermoguttaceae bacterium]|jgi:hypothetical protein